MKNIIRILIVCTLFLQYSCVKDVDFDQADDLELRPTVAASLINFSFSQKEDFIVGTTEKRKFYKRSEIIVFDNKTAKDNLRRIKFDVEVSNEIERDFKISVKFLDVNEIVVYEGLSDLLVSENEPDFEYTDRFSIVNKPELLTAKYMDVTIEMLPSSDGSILDNTLDNNLKFKSFATLYMKF